MRYKRLSADLPQHWLDDPVKWALSDAAWRLYTGVLMWAIGRTDGEVPWTMLSRLAPGTDEDRQSAVRELIAAGLAEESPCCLLLPDWEEHQSTLTQINERREQAKLRQRKHRARSSTEPESPGTSRVTDAVSTERNGTARKRVTPRDEEQQLREEPQTRVSTRERVLMKRYCRGCGKELGEGQGEFCSASCDPWSTS